MEFSVANYLNSISTDTTTNCLDDCLPQGGKFIEQFDLNELKTIVENKVVLEKVFALNDDEVDDGEESKQKDIFVAAKKYLQAAHGSDRVAVTYKTSDSCNAGRLYADGGVSLQGMMRKIR